MAKLQCRHTYTICSDYRQRVTQKGIALEPGKGLARHPAWRCATPSASLTALKKQRDNPVADQEQTHTSDQSRQGPGVTVQCLDRCYPMAKSRPYVPVSRQQSHLATLAA